MNFFHNRERLFELLEDNSAVVIGSADPKQRSNDTNFPFRQDSNFYYLTGFEEPDAYLVMTKKDQHTEAVIFVHPKDPAKEMWEGKFLGVKKAVKHLNVDAAYATPEFEEKLPELLRGTRQLYHTVDEPIGTLTLSLAKLRSGREGHLFPSEHVDINQPLFRLRRYKQSWEVTAIKKALEITQVAHHAAMASANSSKHEYEIQALVEYIFKSRGAQWDAYTTIVAGGNNANTLHYISNRDRLRDGELLLMDAGCEYRLYASDITRTFPVNGKYSPVQKELYEAVLDVQKQVIKMIKPGVMRSALSDYAIKELTQLMIDQKIIKTSLDEAVEKELYKPYYPHGIGHWMGLDVHDPLAYKNPDDTEIAFAEGDVLTIEPGIYLDSSDSSVPKALRGIGIRIEDNILVTDKGHKNLSSKIAKEVADIEKLCEASLYDYI